MALVVIVLCLALKQAALPRYLVRRQFRERRDLGGEFTTSWMVEGYSIHSGTVSHLQWAHFTQWREDVQVILLYQLWQSYTFFPKRVLPPGASEDIRACLLAAGVARAPLFLS